MQCWPIDKGHREVEPPIDFTDVINRAEIGVLDGRHRLGFASEPLGRPTAVSVLFELGHFQRHVSVQLGVTGEIHRPHAAFAKDSLHFVAAEESRHVNGQSRLVIPVAVERTSLIVFRGFKRTGIGWRCVIRFVANKHQCLGSRRLQGDPKFPKRCVSQRLIVVKSIGVITV